MAKKLSKKAVQKRIALIETYCGQYGCDLSELAPLELIQLAEQLQKLILLRLSLKSPDDCCALEASYILSKD